MARRAMDPRLVAIFLDVNAELQRLRAAGFVTKLATLADYCLESRRKALPPLVYAALDAARS